MIKEKIKELRKQANMSQETLASKLHVSRQAVTKWESGLGTPSVDSLIDLSKLFNISMDELVGKSDGQDLAYAFCSDTFYDVDAKKHYDIKFVDATKVTLRLYEGEKVKIKLLSNVIAELECEYKVKIDDIKGRIDIDVNEHSKVNKYGSYDSLVIDISIPIQYVYDIELQGSVQELELSGITNEKMEFKGSANKVICKNIKSHVELDLDSNTEIFVYDVVGSLDVNHLRKASILYIHDDCDFFARKRGIQNRITISDKLQQNVKEDAPFVIELNGVRSELTIDTL